MRSTQFVISPYGELGRWIAEMRFLSLLSC